MKRFLKDVLLLITLSAAIASCTKESKVGSTDKTINKTITANQRSEIIFDNIGDEEEASIYTQPAHASVSKIDRPGKPIYVYVPAVDFVGVDQVKLKFATGSDGASPNTVLSYTIIKFTVTK